MFILNDITNLRTGSGNFSIQAFLCIKGYTTFWSKNSVRIFSAQEKLYIILKFEFLYMYGYFFCYWMAVLFFIWWLRSRTNWNCYVYAHKRRLVGGMCKYILELFALTIDVFSCLGSHGISILLMHSLLRNLLHFLTSCPVIFCFSFRHIFIQYCTKTEDWHQLRQSYTFLTNLWEQWAWFEARSTSI